MKHFLSFILCLLLTFSVNAQVKGHVYYNFDFSIDDDIKGEIWLEVEKNGSLAIGQIQYAQSDEAMHLFGYRLPNNPNVLYLEEHKFNGQWCGQISLYLDNGVIQRGEWSSVTEELTLPFQYHKLKPFPYDRYHTFFFPSEDNYAIGGHFISYKRIGKAIRNDRALNIVPFDTNAGFFSIEASGNTQLLGGYNWSEGNSFEYTLPNGEEKPTSFEVKVFGDVAFVSVTSIGPNAQGITADGIFVREAGVLEQTTWGPTGDIFSVRVRLENNIPSLLVSKKRLAVEKDSYPESTLEAGRHELYNLQGRVMDMVVCDIGMEINPQLCLLLEDNTVQILSLTDFRENGVTYLSDPLPNVYDIQRFAISDPNAEPEEPQECDDGGIVIYGIDSKGQAHSVMPNWDEGDFMLNPKNTIDCEGYLGFSKFWSIHLYFDEEGSQYSYFGQYWVVEDAAGPDGFITIGYHMTMRRNDRGDNMEQQPCDIRGSFKYRHNGKNWEDIDVTPLDGLMFIPKGKTMTFTRMHAVG